MFFYNQINQYTTNKIREDLIARGYIIEQIVMNRSSMQFSYNLNQIIKNVAKKSKTRITLIQPNGDVILDSTGSSVQLDNHINRPEIQKSLNNELGIAIRLSQTLKKSMMYVALPIQNGHPIIRLAVPMTKVGQLNKLLLTRLIILSLIIMLVTIIIAYILTRKLTAPIKKLTKIAYEYSKENFEHPIPKTNSREIHNLALAMRTMVSLLQDRIKKISSERNEKEAIINNMLEGVISINEKRVITQINHSAINMLELGTINKIIGKNIDDIIKVSQLTSILDLALKGTVVSENDFEIRPSTKKSFIVNAIPLKAENKKINAVIVLHDITKLKKLERIRQDFVANVSHELKTPITIINMSLETLQTASLSKDDDSKTFLNMIEQNCERLNLIINDLLMLSKLEANPDEFAIAKEESNITEMVEKCIQACRIKAKSKEIKLELLTKKEIKFIGNFQLLNQAITNLLVNAIKYSLDHSTVKIMINETISDVHLIVIDQGIGIAKNHLNKLFQRFYRVDTARSRKQGGTGLGLSIVKHIAQIHSGTVSVESEPNKGSTFTIILPKKSNQLLKLTT